MNKEIKVLHIIPNLALGGAERQLIEILSHNKEHEACLLLSDNEDQKYKNINNNIHSLNMKRKMPDIRAFFRLNKIINIINPQIIHCWMYHSSLIEVIIRKFIRNKNIPLIWGLRCSNMDVNYYSIQFNFVIKACRYFSGIPNVIINNSYQGKVIHDKIGFNNKSIVIPNGIDTKKFSPNKKYKNNFRASYNLGENVKVLLCVARFDAMKDHLTLIEAFQKIIKKYSNTYLILAGLGTERFSNIKNVIALGAYKKIEEVYASADIIISSSAFGEGFSNAIGEGMSSELIAVSTNVGDAKYIIKDSGLVVPPKSINELAGAVIKIIDLPNKDFIKMRKKARIRIIKNFSKELMLKNYSKVYNKLLPNRGY